MRVRALDLETTTLRPAHGEILCVGTSWAAIGQPVEAAAASRPRGMRVGSPEDLRRLQALLRGPEVLAVHDVRMEGSWAEGFLGVRLSGDRVLDTKLLANRVHPNCGASLAALVARYLPEVSGYKADTEDLIRQGRVREIPMEDLLRRVAVDAWATARLAEKLYPQVPEPARRWLAEDVDLALCVERIAERGVLFDEEEAFRLKEESEARQAELTARWGFNLGSSQQLDRALAGLGVVLPRTGKDNPASDEVGLRRLLDGALADRARSLILDVLEYRGLQKVRGTYVEGYAKRRSPDGRIRSDLYWPGTVSWRLSSSDPNLQNVPVGCRNLFRARDGYVLIEADYAQAELRVAAALAPEPRLSEVFRAGGDPHSLFAEVLFGSGFTRDQRHTAKTGNFQLRYGAGAYGFQKMLLKEGKVLPLRECHRVRSGFWDTYKGFGDHVERQYRVLKEGGYLESPTAGYRWCLEDGFLKHPDDEGEALRSVENAVIQCVPPRWTLRAAYKAEREGLDVVLQTHDGLLLEVPEAEVVSATNRIAQIMAEESAEDFMQGLPVPADTKSGKRWGSLTQAPGG